MVKSSFAAKTVALVLAALLCAACLLTLAACKKKGDSEVDVENGNNAAVTNRETDGQKYTFDSDCELFVLIGVDEGACTDPDGNELGGGRANAVFIASANTKTQKIDLVQLDQNTMVEMKTFDRWGLSAGTTVAQLSLAYAYGGTENESGANVLYAVKALTGLPVESYVAIKSTAMEALARVSGAVTVTLTEAYENNAAGSTLTLQPAEFQEFLRDQGLGIQANQKRMSRMRDFVPAFFEALKGKAELATVEDKLNANFNVAGKMADYGEYDLNKPVVTPKGQAQMVGDFVEFTVDADDLNKILVGVCFKKEG